jgi:hypothetical protein
MADEINFVRKIKLATIKQNLHPRDCTKKCITCDCQAITDLASSYHQLLVLACDRWKTSFRSQLGQFEWNVVPFGLQGALLLMRVMNQALTVGLGTP